MRAYNINLLAAPPVPSTYSGECDNCGKVHRGSSARASLRELLYSETDGTGARLTDDEEFMSADRWLLDRWLLCRAPCVRSLISALEAAPPRVADGVDSGGCSWTCAHCAEESGRSGNFREVIFDGPGYAATAYLCVGPCLVNFLTKGALTNENV